jgi:hypothetical protein
MNETIAYKGWPNCYRMANGHVELIITTDVGPRVIRFGFVGGDNEFKEYTEQLGKTGGNAWRVYGGHRLWHAPEQEPRTYYPDNEPVKLEQHEGFVRLIQPVEVTTGMQKEMDIRLATDAARVEVLHRLRNTNRVPVELAPWALSVMAPGGVAIVPLPPRGSHPEDLPPGNSLTLWKYTDMTDPRWGWGRQYILLRQDSSPAVKPQKLGMAVLDGWAAYARDGRLFVKTFGYRREARYADFGCNFETFTNREMLEMETLGPLTSIAPGAAVEHAETWRLFRDVPAPRSDADCEKHILPHAKTTR